MQTAASLILMASANPSSWHRVREALAGTFTVIFAVDLEGTKDVLERHRPAVLVLASRLLDASLEEAFARLSGQHSARTVVIAGAGESPARFAGADACLPEAQVEESLVGVIEELCGGRPAGSRAKPDAPAECALAEGELVLGHTAAVQRLMEMARDVAPLDVDVLLVGETGTGKEVLAHWIHRMSHRAKGPFEAVDLPAIPTELFESILFGHERGSFTGAVAQNAGKFQRARKGTLFLDEVSSLRLELQPKLLRAIQEKEIESVGATGAMRCDVRIVAATNMDLAQAVKRGEFRADLYYRLNVVTLRLVPLRERREDLPELVQFFVKKYAQRFRCSEPSVSSETLQALRRYDWPGNIRELEHCVQRAVVLCRTGKLRPEDLLPPEEQTAAAPVHFGKCMHSLEQIEQMYIERVLEETEGNQSKAAQILQIDRKTLRAKLQQREAEQELPGQGLRSVS